MGEEGEVGEEGEEWGRRGGEGTNSCKADTSGAVKQTDGDPPAHTHTCHALLGQRGGVVYWDVVQLRMAGPVLVQNEEQFLRTAECKHGNETATSSSHYVMNGTCMCEE